jgi:hypothetical protein
LTSPLPDTLPFESACVLPLAIATAAAGLFQRDFLALTPPSADPQPTNETLIVWGGSTSVGSNAIQLAAAAGYDVIATASPKNFDYLKRLGADPVFDYRKKSIVEDLVGALDGRTVAGAMAIGKGGTGACINVLARCEGKRFVAVVTPPASFKDVPAGRRRWRKLLPVFIQLAVNNVFLTMLARLRGVKTKFVWGGAPVDNEIGPTIFQNFLPSALADDRYVVAPRAQVVGLGLDMIPEALEQQRRGVSARKLVGRL